MVSGLTAFQRDQIATAKLEAEKSFERLGSATLDKDSFLKLMLIQLKNQDPTNPFDSKDMAAQQAQFSTLEQLQNLNTTIETANQINQASSLIGRNVILKDPNDQEKTISGKVTEANLNNGKATVVINNTDYPLDLIQTIK